MTAVLPLHLSIQYADTTLITELTRSRIRRWVRSAQRGPAEFTIRFVDEEEGRTLNLTYRGKDYATNVLTFSYNEDLPPQVAAELPDSADIVLCSQILQKEAVEQHKPLIAHAAHLIVHGVLHAHGYDHEDPAEAEEMETLEVDVLRSLGFPDPYQLPTSHKLEKN
jgi:probable rRNA maturation factor